MNETGEGEEARCGFVALIGAPNAGKSTLLNTMVGAKVSIVTHKVQTTRALVRGIAVEAASQIVFMDTPGIFTPKRRLDRAMVNSAWGGAKDADLVGVLIDAQKGLNDEARSMIERLKDVHHPIFLILNKIDLLKREKLLAVAQESNGLFNFERTFMVSAQSGNGVGDLKSWLAGRMPEGHWHYPEDQLSDLPLRMLAAEITREKLFIRLHDELPYSSTVETEKWELHKNKKSVRIEQTIYVERDSQKSIVLGKGGATIKAISMAARGDIAEAAEMPVHLFIFVKVRENWADDPERYREMGLPFTV
jgi:GTP-binding protein Era